MMPEEEFQRIAYYPSPRRQATKAAALALISIALGCAGWGLMRMGSTINLWSFLLFLFSLLPGGLSLQCFFQIFLRLEPSYQLDPFGVWIGSGDLLFWDEMHSLDAKGRDFVVKLKTG